MEMAVPHPSYSDHSQFWPPQPIPSLTPPNNNINPVRSLVYSQPWKQRRAPRAAQACDSCRVRKKACDEGRPCTNCEKDEISCRYSSRKSSRHLTDIETAFHQFQSRAAEMADYIRRFDEFKPRFDELSARLYEAETSLSRHPGYAVAVTPRKQTHSSGVHHLFSLWPSVRKLLYQARQPIDPAYVEIAEDQQSGSAGQVWRARPSPFGGLLPHLEDRAVDRSWTTEPSSFELPAGGDDGPRYPLLLPQHRGHRLSLLKSYAEHMHLLHPIVNLNHVESLLDDDGPRIGQKRNSITPYLTDGSGDATPSHSFKRRRIDMDRLDEVMEVANGRTEPRSPLETALLYVILALGEICAHKKASVQPWGKPVSEPASANPSFQSNRTGTSADNSPVGRASPRQGPSAATPRGPGSFSLSSASTLEDVGPTMPGMKYYSCATQVLGAYLDGNELMHAQIAVLAGLYKGQLGQVRESMNWICIAGRIVHYLLQQHNLLETTDVLSLPDGREALAESQKKRQGRIKVPKHDLIVLTAWTCIQLESDILAELQFPPSGILACEDQLPSPNRIPGADAYGRLLSEECIRINNLGSSRSVRPEDRGKGIVISSHNVLMFYQSQLWLRKLLNRVQEQLHGDVCATYSEEQLLGVVSDHQSSLASFRATLPLELRWEDGDSLAEGILAARLRAKYWGAHFLVHRPYLDYVLHIRPGLAYGTDMDTLATDAHGRPRKDAVIRLFQAINKFPEEETLDCARSCVDAAFQSCRAFDRIPHELIVTNMHGTAHAYVIVKEMG